MSKLNKLVYINAFVIGFVIMAFEMLGSRYLNPYFGSSIFTWAALITVVMIALAIGYFLGGLLADKGPSTGILGVIIISASIWLFFIPSFSDFILEFISELIYDPRYAALLASSVILLFPLSLLGAYSPYAIRLILSETKKSGALSGRIYSISTLGSVFGTLGVTFYMIPLLGTHMITYILAGIAAITGLSFIIFNRIKIINRTSNSILFTVILIFSQTNSYSLELTNQEIQNLPNGVLEHKESLYNDIYITKQNNVIKMFFQRYRNTYTESTRDLDNPLSLPVKYTQYMTLGLVYQPNPLNVMMLGLGGGSTTKYLSYYYPNTTITAVELDRDVVNMAKKYFAIRETNKYKIIINDARIYLKRNKKKYDMVMMDTFRGGYIPFHLLTKEFFNLLKKRMTKESYLVINLHSGSKMFDSSVKTLKNVFSHVDMFSEKTMGNVIVIAYDKKIKIDLKASAKKIQKEKNFYHDLNKLIKTYKHIAIDNDAELFTDDFAPVNMYKEISNKNAARW